MSSVTVWTFGFTLNEVTDKKRLRNHVLRCCCYFVYPLFVSSGGQMSQATWQRCLITDKHLHVQINEDFHVCPLQLQFPQMTPHSVLEGYLYPVTFSCVLIDYKKALINSAGWGLTVTLALNSKVLEWFVGRFFVIKTHTEAVQFPPNGPRRHWSSSQMTLRQTSGAKSAAVLPLKQDIVQFVLASEPTGRTASQGRPGCADVHLGTSQAIRKSGGEWQPSLSSSCLLTARMLPHTDNPHWASKPCSNKTPNLSAAPRPPPAEPETPHTNSMLKTASPCNGAVRTESGSRRAPEAGGVSSRYSFHEFIATIPCGCW